MIQESGSLKPLPPKTEDFAVIRNDRHVLNWFTELDRWHGYIRFLGLPQMRDLVDVKMRKLYVPPRFAKTHVTPDKPLKEWPESTGLLDLLTNHQRLVLLGDPGSGKSSLVNWIVVKLATPHTRTWEQHLGQLLPVPMVLRDLTIGRDITWDTLWKAYLDQPKNARVADDFPLEYLERGQALIMLDGFDEIGDKKTREALRQAIYDGMKRYPRCRWLITTRIVGYEEIPLHGGASSLLGKKPDADALSKREQMFEALAPTMDALYLMPFNNRQITVFVEAWYFRHDVRSAASKENTDKFLKAIRSNANTFKLARIPNLLTMMALIHRVRAYLPQGRVELYNDIARAYLQSIDEYRGLDTPAYSLDQKMRWLARIGYEMQLRRKGFSFDREILVDRKTVHQWLSREMEEMGVTGGNDEADAFLDYVTRRSGLLLPRGQDQYAFMHLSFQEYFAAVWLEEELLSPSSDKLFSQLKQWVDESQWRETFILLFERLASRRGWSDHLFKQVFDLEGNTSRFGIELIVELINDTYTGLSPETRDLALSFCWDNELAYQSKEFEEKVFHVKTIFSNLLNSFGERGWEILRDYEPKALVIWNEVDFPRIGKLTSLENLCIGIVSCDIEFIYDLPRLKDLKLFLGQTGPLDLRPIPTLKYLSISIPLEDINILAQMDQLEEVEIVLDRPELNVFAGLTQLKKLYLNGAVSIDLGPLRSLQKLSVLSLGDLSVENLGPLIDLPNLQKLVLPSSFKEANIPAALLNKKDLAIYKLEGYKEVKIEIGQDNHKRAAS